MNVAKLLRHNDEVWHHQTVISVKIVSDATPWIRMPSTGAASHRKAFQSSSSTHLIFADHFLLHVKCLKIYYFAAAYILKVKFSQKIMLGSSLIISREKSCVGLIWV